MNETSEPASHGPADPLIGQLLAGRYRILSKLGEGAMGAVYLGEHVRMGRRDAIKVLRKDIGQDAEAMSRFVRGARNVSLIRHPNVCTIYDFSDTAEGQQFLAMEFIEGETLKDLLDREGRLELHRALRITQQVADALQAAHDAGVIHRDLKPGNVMITRRSDGGEAVKVVDFDIAKGPNEAEGEEVTRLGFVVGTPEYMSPEQLMGERVDGRSDLYSLAVMLFRMLTAALPFRATATQDMMIERLTSAPVPLEEALPGSQLPPQLGAVIAQALARKREDRHAGTAAFMQSLQAAAEGRPACTATPPPGAPPATAPQSTAVEMPQTVVAPAITQTRMTQTTRRRGVLAVAALALVAVTAAGVALLRSSDDGIVTTAPPAEAPDADAFPVTSAAAPAADAPSAGTSPATVPTAEPNEPSQPDVRPAPAAAARPPETRVLSGPVATVLDRQFLALTDNPSAAALRAIRDTAAIAWDLAATREDSASAAMILAQAAMTARDDVDCRRWARRAAELGARVEMILQICG